MEKVITESNEQKNDLPKIVKERNLGVDILRFICAFLVVCIHKPFPSFIGGFYLVALARIAVPAFFMITGYFFINASQEKKRKQIKRVFFLIILSSVGYFIFDVIFFGLTSDIGAFFARFTDVKYILVECLGFNNNPFHSVLWFLSAMLYTLIILYFCSKKFDLSKLFFLIPILLVGNLLFFVFFPLFINGFEEIFLIYRRNFIFIGIPFTLLGAFVKKNGTKFRIKCYFLLTCLFTITLFIERFVYDMFGLPNPEYYVSVIPLVYCVFVLFLNIPFKGKFFEKISLLGKKYSLGIYIVHYGIIHVFDYLVNNYITSIKNIYSFVAPLLVFVLSLFLSWLWGFLKQKIMRSTKENLQNV